MNLQDKIAKAKTQHYEAEPIEVHVEVGGEDTVLTFLPIWGEDWNDIIAVHPARVGSETDAGVGYNTDAVASDYPLSAVTVDGADVEREQWQDLLSVLSGPDRTTIASTLYYLNKLLPAKKLVEAVGKAQKG